MTGECNILHRWLVLSTKLATAGDGGANGRMPRPSALRLRRLFTVVSSSRRPMSAHLFRSSLVADRVRLAGAVWRSFPDPPCCAVAACFVSGGRLLARPRGRSERLRSALCQERWQASSARSAFGPECTGAGAQWHCGGEGLMHAACAPGRVLTARARRVSPHANAFACPRLVPCRPHASCKGRLSASHARRVVALVCARRAAAPSAWLHPSPCPVATASLRPQ